MTAITQIASEEIALSKSNGRILRKQLLADRAIPPFDRVMMDGIALDSRVWNTDQRAFPVCAIQPAGSPAKTLKSSGHCIEVMTGAILPNGCDCVVKIEDVDIRDGVAHIQDSAQPKSGMFIHRYGSDLAQGCCILKTGQQLGPAELAIAASCGATTLEVSNIPSVHLITTGDEVIAPHLTPEPYQIRSSHPSAVIASIESQQLGNVVHHHLSDDQNLAEEQIARSLAAADVIVLTGGVSKGKFDYVAPALNKLIGTPLFHGVSQRPGKPFAFFAAPTPVFALPGNPVSVMACLARYLLPALRKIQGLPAAEQPLPLAEPISLTSDISCMIACRMSNGRIHPAQPNNSGDYRALSNCHGVAQLNPTQSTFDEGELLTFYPWG